MLNAKMRQIRLHALAGTVLSVAALVPQSALAQAASTNDVASPPAASAEIVVSANRRDTVISKTPYNISAYSGEQLAKANITTVTALTRQVPNFTIVDTGARSSQSSLPIIRGLNASQASGLFEGARGAQAPVGYYVDNAPLNASLPLMDVARVEVLRGPQGTLYGAGTLAGAVRIVTNQPKLGEFSGLLSVAGGAVAHSSDHNYSLDATLNVPLGETIALRVSGRQQRNAGFINQHDIMEREGDNYLSGLPVAADPSDPLGSPAVYFDKKDVNWDTTTAARVALLWQPTAEFKATLAYAYAHVRGNGAALDNYTYPGGPSPVDARRTLAPTGEYEISSSALEPFRRTTHQATFDASYDMGFATLATTLAYQRTSGENSIDANRHILGIPFFSDYYTGNPANPRFAYAYQNTDTDRQTTEEIRLVSNTKGGAFDYVIGAFFQQQKRELGLNSFNPGAQKYNGPFGPLYVDANNQFLTQINSQDYHEASLYGNLTWHPTDRWQITGGGRVFHETFSAALIQNRGQTIVPPSSNRTKLTSQIFMANTSYDVSSAIKAYATWSQGFRRGGANPFLTDETSLFSEASTLKTYTPDKTNNFEVGIKGRAAGIYVSLAAFYIKWDKPQIDMLTPYYGYSAVVNGSKASSKGIELEASGQTGLEGLTFNLGVAYSKARLTRPFAIRSAISIDPATGLSIFADNGITGLKGDRLPGAPDYSASFDLQYAFAVGKGANLTMNAGMDYRSSTVNDLTPVNGLTIIATSPGYATVRGGIDLDVGKWTVSLNATNLLDKHVVYSRGVSNTFQQGLGGYGDTYYVGRPREVTLRVSYKW